MSFFRSSTLLKFLENPRHTSDVATHFRMPKRLAESHLRSAIKTGSILVSEEKVAWKIVGSNRASSQGAGYLHIRRGSPLLIQHAEASNLNVRGVKFLSKAVHSRGGGRKEGRAWFLPLDSDRRNHIIKGRRRTPSSAPYGSGAAWWVKPISRRIQPLTHATQFDLLKNLSNEELALGEIHRRTGVSKHTVKRLVQKGILLEEWGPHGVGIRYKLSGRGGKLLRGIEAASSLATEARIRHLPLNTKTPF